MPGPNFGFSVYLGILSLPQAPALGGILAYLAIFAPGLLLKAALIPVYRKIRDKPVVRHTLLGLNAGATGLIFSAVCACGLQSVWSMPDDLQTDYGSSERCRKAARCARVLQEKATAS